MSDVLNENPILVLVNPTDFRTGSGTNPWIAAGRSPTLAVQRYNLLQSIVLEKANPSSPRADPGVGPTRFDGSTLPPVPSQESPPIPQKLNTGLFSECDPFGPAAEALNGLADYYANQIIDPAGALVDQMLSANDELKGLFVIPFKASLDTIFTTSSGKIRILQKNAISILLPNTQVVFAKSANILEKGNSLAGYPKDVAPVSQSKLAELSAGIGAPPNVGLGSDGGFRSNTDEVISSLTSKENVVKTSQMKTDDFLASIGLPVIQNKGDVEKALRARGIYIVNGLYLKTGELDLTACKVLARLLGTEDPVRLSPYLGKPDGAFTFIISRIYQQAQQGPIADCKPVELPYGTCAVPEEQVVTIEEVLGIDVSIQSVLASHPKRKREELTFYVFWQTFPSYNKPIINALRALGLTDDEFSAAFTVVTTEQVKPYVIKEPSKVLDFAQRLFGPESTILADGPNGVDPSPSSDALIQDIKDKASSTSSPMNPGSNISDFTNVPSLVIGALDLNKTFDCRSLLDLLSSANAGVTAAIQGSGTAFDLANFVLSQAQSAINGVGNEIQNMLSMAEQFGQKFPGSLVQCLYAGQSLSLGISLPRAAIDGLNFLLNTVIDKVLGFFDLLDKLLLGLLTGLCVSVSFLTGLAGANAATNLISANLDCASFDVPLPAAVLEGLRCLIAILQLVQELVNRAISVLRNLIATLQSLAFQFNLTQSTNLGQCLPPVVAASKLTIESLIKGSGVL